MSILDEAKEIVNNSRQAEYNDPVENAVREALVLSAVYGGPFSPKDMVLAMQTKKLIRSGRGYKHDNVVDKAGYAEIEERIEKAMKDGTVQKIVETILGGWVKFDNPHGSELLRGKLDYYQTNRLFSHDEVRLSIVNPQWGEDLSNVGLTDVVVVKVRQ